MKRRDVVDAVAAGAVAGAVAGAGTLVTLAMVAVWDVARIWRATLDVEPAATEPERVQMIRCTAVGVHRHVTDAEIDGPYYRCDVGQGILTPQHLPVKEWLRNDT